MPKMSPSVADDRRVHRVRLEDVNTVPPPPATTHVPPWFATPMSVWTVPVGRKFGSWGLPAGHDSTAPPVPTATVVVPSDPIPRNVWDVAGGCLCHVWPLGDVTTTPLLPTAVKPVGPLIASQRRSV